MKKKFELTFLVLTIVFGLSFIANVILNKYTGYRLNIEFWTAAPLSLILFGVAGLMAFCFLMIKSKKALFKVMYILIAVISLFYLGVFVSFGSEKPKTYELDTVKVHVLEYRFIFDGEDRFYKRDNWLWSHHVQTFQNNEDASTSYTFDGDTLTAIETFYGAGFEVYVIDFAQE